MFCSSDIEIVLFSIVFKVMRLRIKKKIIPIIVCILLRNLDSYKKYKKNTEKLNRNYLENYTKAIRKEAVFRLMHGWSLKSFKCNYRLILFMFMKNNEWHF